MPIYVAFSNDPVSAPSNDPVSARAKIDLPDYPACRVIEQ